MARPHGLRDAIDGVAVRDVTSLRLASELLGERAEAFLAAREQDRSEAASGKRPRDCLADPARRAGDDRYPLVRQALAADANDACRARSASPRVA
jgi:hypothetical protein